MERDNAKETEEAKPTMDQSFRDFENRCEMLGYKKKVLYNMRPVRDGYSEPYYYASDRSEPKLCRSGHAVG